MSAEGRRAPVPGADGRALGALVGAERARVRTALAGALALGTLAVLAGGGAAAAAALAGGRWLALPPLAPAAAWVGLLAVAAAFAAAARARFGGEAGDAAVTRAVEHERALRAGSLRAAREVAAAGPLGARAADALARALAAHGPALAPRWLARARRRLALGAAALLVAAAGLAAAGAWAGDGLRALAHPVDAARGTLLAPLRVLGAPDSIARGRPLTVAVAAPGRRAVRARWRVAGRAWAERALQPDAGGRAVLALGPVDADLALVVDDGRARTDTVRVRAVARPFVGELAVRAEYPAYLARPAASLPAGDALRVPRGTALLVTGRASTPLGRATIAGPGGSAVLAPDAADARSLTARFVPEASGRWAVSAVDARGGAAEAPAPLDVVVVPDSAPTVEFVSPASDSAVDGLGDVRAALRAADDHGLAGVSLRTWVRRAGGARERDELTSLAAGVGGGAWSGDAVVRLGAAGLRPGDALHVQAVAADASPWRQTGVSRVLVLRVPDAATLRAAARRAADSAAAGAAAAASSARGLQERTANAARARGAERASGQGNAGGPSFEAAERARTLAAEQRRLADQIAATREQAAALERRLQQSGALDTALARQLADVQKLLRDALTPELAARLSELEQQAAAGGDTRASLEQLNAQQRALREQLEQSAEMLRRAALEGAMQTLRDDARELAGAQARAAERLAAGARPPSTPQSGGAPEESPAALAERTRQITSEIDALGKRLARARAEPGARRADAARADAARSAASMAQAAGEPAAGERAANDPARRAPLPAERAGPSPEGGARAPARAAGESGAEGASPPGGDRPNGAPQDASRAGAPRGESPNGAPDGASPGAAGAARAARAASAAMESAASQLADARRQQIDAWKGELGAALDRAVQEAQQLAREQQQLARDARDGRDPAALRAAQAAVQQGAEQAARRVEEAGRRSSLVSPRARRAMDDARQEVAQASQALQRSAGGTPNAGAPGAPRPGGGSPGGSQGGPAQQLGEAGDALARAASALVRDRERVRGASSSTGFEEMVEQMRQLAGQQGQINQQAGGLPMPGQGAGGQAGRDGARRLARQQRGVASQLEELGDADPSGRSDALAREARQLAQALERQGAGAAPDPATAARQQQLYRRMLEAGRTLEQDERDEQGRREARAGGAVVGAAPATGAESGRAAGRYAPPAWADLRALGAEERRLVGEYFRRLNGAAEPLPAAPSPPGP